jgi:hypothetical protein
MITAFSQLNLGSVEHVWVEYHVAESSPVLQICSLWRISKVNKNNFKKSDAVVVQTCKLCDRIIKRPPKSHETLPLRGREGVVNTDDNNKCCHLSIPICQIKRIWRKTEVNSLKGVTQNILKTHLQKTFLRHFYLNLFVVEVKVLDKSHLEICWIPSKSKENSNKKLGVNWFFVSLISG